MSVAVVNKIESILHSSYHTKNYVDFIREIFPGVRIVAPDKFNKEYSNFSSHIEGYLHVGTFQTPDKKKILIMAVQQRKAGYVENARSTQRSFAKKLIENGNADAALIAFYTDGDSKWRLSLVRLDYEMKIENGRLKTAENPIWSVRMSHVILPSAVLNALFPTVLPCLHIPLWMIWKRHSVLRRSQTNFSSCTVKNSISCGNSWSPLRISVLKPSSIISLLHSSLRS